MDRCRSGLGLALLAALLMALAGCAGKSSNTGSNSAVQSVTLNPTGNISLDLGSTNQFFTATARNGVGQIIPANIKFATGCAPDIPPCAPITVATNGQLCAGTWDSLTNPIICTPGVVGVAQVTAVVGGISSAPATIYVHQHIDNIKVTATSPPPADCFSLGDPDARKRTATFQATAFSNGIDITNSVGPINWSSTNANVLTIDSNNQLPTNEVQITAKVPGITNLFASVSGVNSSPLQFTTCLVRSVFLQIQNGAGHTINFTNGGSQTIEATALDTLGNPVSNPPLTWGSTNTEIATVTATTTNGTNTVTAKANLGGANVFAACEPPSCNIGVLPALPIYSSGALLLNGKPDPSPPNPNDKPAFGALFVNVTNSKVPTYTAWTATKDCADELNCTSAMFSVTTSNNPIGATVILPFTPNSLLITPDGAQAYLGSDKGLMIVNGLGGNPTVGTASQQTTPCNVALCGRVLAISPDSKRVVIGDTATDPNQVYIFSSGSSPVDLIVQGATTATFSPDGLKLFILTNTGTMYVYSTVDALVPVPVATTTTDAAFSADGSFAYVAGTPVGAVSGFATCNQADIGTSPVLSASPVRIFPLAETEEIVDHSPADRSEITQNLLAVAPPNVQLLTAKFARDPLPDGKMTCNPPSTSFTAPANQIFNLGQGNFTPLYMGLAGSGPQFGEKIVVVAQNVPAALVFDANAKNTSAFPLVNNAFPLAASASPDGSQIFVAACEAFKNGDPKQCTAGSVHIVNTQSGGDIQQTPFTNPNTQNSMCFGLDPNTTFCVPNLIAVRPQ
jgi:hypothetical protein